MPHPGPWAKSVSELGANSWGVLLLQANFGYLLHSMALIEESLRLFCHSEPVFPGFDRQVVVSSEPQQNWSFWDGSAPPSLSMTHRDIVAVRTVLSTGLAKGPTQTFTVGPIRREHKASGTFYASEQCVHPAPQKLEKDQRFSYGHEEESKGEKCAVCILD